MFTVELYAKIRRAVMVDGVSRREASSARAQALIAPSRRKLSEIQSISGKSSMMLFVT